MDFEDFFTQPIQQEHADLEGLTQQQWEKIRDVKENAIDGMVHDIIGCPKEKGKAHLEVAAIVYQSLAEGVEQLGKLWNIDVSRQLGSVHYKLASTYFVLGLLDAALASYRKLLVPDKSDKGWNPAAHEGMGDVYFARGDLTNANAKYELARSSSIGVLGPGVNIKAAIVKLRLGDYSGVVAIVEPSLEKFVENYPKCQSYGTEIGTGWMPSAFGCLLGEAYKALGTLEKGKPLLIDVFEKTKECARDSGFQDKLAKILDAETVGSSSN